MVRVVQCLPTLSSVPFDATKYICQLILFVDRFTGRKVESEWIMRKLLYFFSFFFPRDAFSFPFLRFVYC